MRITLSILLSLIAFSVYGQDTARGRARDFGISPGILTPGKFNAITDVAGVKVGHTTMVVGDSIRTGVTVILPHGDNIFQEKVPAAVYVGNGFGKAIGFTQIQELGNIESPIALTNTLNSWKVSFECINSIQNSLFFLILAAIIFCLTQCILDGFELSFDCGSFGLVLGIGLLQGGEGGFGGG
mgnify:CR=1 FL=1